MRISTEMNFGFLKGALFTAALAAAGLAGCDGGDSAVSGDNGSATAESSSSSTGSKDSAAVSSSGGASDTTAADTVDYAKYAAMGAGTYVLGNGDTLLVLSDTARATVEAINSMLTYLGAGPETATSSSSAAASSSSASALKKTSAVSSTEVVSSTGSLISDIPILKQMNVSAINGVTKEYIYKGFNDADGSSKYSVKYTNTRTGDVDYDTVAVSHPSANEVTIKGNEFGEVTNYVFTNKGINVYGDGSFLYTITKDPAKSNGIVLTNNEGYLVGDGYATVDTEFYPVVTSAE